MRTEQFKFEGSRGEVLAARLDLPPGRPVATALFAHCFTCSKDSHAAARIARGLVSTGIGVLRFDFTGLGSSQGDFANTNFSSNVDDLVRAEAALHERFDGPRILLGHSLGGTAVLAAASRIPEAAAVATINAPFDPAHVIRLFPAAELDELKRKGEVVVEIARRRFRIRDQFLVDVGAHHLDHAIRALRRPLLILHAPTDEIVSVDNARRIFDAARHPKGFVALDGADHLLTKPADGAFVAAVVAAWAGRYVGGDAPDALLSEATPEGTVVVTEGGPGMYEQVIRAGRHALASDEPAPLGDDAGPTPYDLLLAALGSCSSMTIRMYAERKHWPLERVEVRLIHRRLHADTGHHKLGTGTVDEIVRELQLIGPLSPDQRSRLVDMAERCPVHRTLVGEKRLVTRLAGEHLGVDS